MQKIEITARTIIFTILFLLSLKFVWLIKDLIFSLFIAFIIMSALRPFVNFLSTKTLPRGLSAFIVYFVFLGLFIKVITIAVPPLLIESAHLARNLPGIIESVVPNSSTLLNLDSLVSYLPNITDQFINIVRSVFSNTVFLISTIFFGFYFLVEEDIIKKFMMRFSDQENARKIAAVFEKAEKRMSAWFWGELVLMTVVGTMTFIGLNLIGMRYVLPLAVLAGLLEAIPNLGPVISMVPAVLIGFSTSYILGFSAVALYFIVQQLENNLIVPIIMKKAVGLNPIVTLIALIVGAKIGGVLGVLLAIPSTLSLETILTEFIGNKKFAENMR